MFSHVLDLLSVFALLATTLASQRKGWGLAQAWVLWLFPLSEAGLFAYWFASTFSLGLSPAFSAAVFALCLLCCVANWFLFTGLVSAAEYAVAFERTRILKEQTSAQEEQFAYAEQWQQEADEFRAGLAKCLHAAYDAVVRGDDAAAQRFLGDVTDAVKPRSRRWCQNQALDALLSFKVAQLEEAGIAISCQVDAPAEMPLSSTELCAVFSNLLDNAKRACEALPAGERTAELKAGMQGNMFVVRMENVKATEAAFSSRRKTASGDALPEHGWGLSILEIIARRHDGVFEARDEGGRFCTMVALAL